MKKSLIIILVIIGVIFISAMWFMGTYNSLIKQEQGIEGQWAQVETQYQRRFDLIPNLVNSVKGIMEQEQEVFGKIAEARTKYGGASKVSDKIAAAGELESALARLLVIIENYPELKSAENVQTLMAQLEGTENRIAVERRRYNERVEQFNKDIRVFPRNLIASMFGFEKKAYFESVEGAEEAPKVEF